MSRASRERWHQNRAAGTFGPAYRSRIPPRGFTLRCKICSVATDRVLITTGNGPGQVLTTHTFCGNPHAAQGGFPWAGQRR